MMKKPSVYIELAERELHRASQAEGREVRDACIARAQVYATLAVASATDDVALATEHPA